jgi:hypothetical protein
MQAYLEQKKIVYEMGLREYGIQIRKMTLRALIKVLRQLLEYIGNKYEDL